MLTAEAKAHLDSGHVRLSSPFRLTLPAASLQGVVDEALLFNTPEGAVALCLGAVTAAKWADRLRNPKSLRDKLGVRPGQGLALLGTLPPALAETLADLVPAAVEAADWLFIGFNDTAALAGFVLHLPQARADAAIWAIYPKSRIDPAENAIRAIFHGAGWRDVKVCAVDAQLTAAKFIRPTASRNR